MDFEHRSVDFSLPAGAEKTRVLEQIHGAWPAEWQLISVTATGSQAGGHLHYRLVFRRPRIIHRPARAR